MIIYGWGQFNRRNYSTIRRQCESCGQYGYHQSYECSRFATLYFIPVIPFGGYKITAECPQCKAALGLSKRKWRHLLKKDLPSAISAYEANPGDPEAAKQLLCTSVGCQSRETLRRFGPEIRERFAKDNEMVALLASAYSYLCMDDAADALYLQALENDPSEEIAEQSDLHLRAKALPRPKPKNRLLQSLPVLIFPAVVLYFVTGGLVDSLKNGVEQAVLVNGLDIAYSVEINGKRVELPPGARRQVEHVKFGENVISVTGSDPGIHPFTFEVNVPVHRRLLDPPTVVVNPDQTAILLWEQTEYTSGFEGDYRYRLAAGENAYVYQDIDFFLTGFPDEIEIPSSRSRVQKTRLSLVEYPDLDLVQALLANGMMAEASTFLRQKLMLNADARPLVAVAASLLPPEDLLALIKPKLGRSPVEIEYHRYYQNSIENLRPEHDLTDEYRVRLAADPENPAWLYLLARIVEDVEESTALLRKAAAICGETGYASYALAYHEFLAGNPGAAERYIRQAVERAPDNQQFAAMQTRVLLANGNRIELEKFARRNLQVNPFDTASFVLHLNAAYDGRNHVTLDDEIKAYCGRLQTDGNYASADVVETQVYLRSCLAALQNDGTAYKKAIGLSKDPSWNFQRAVLEGRLSDAYKLSQNENPDPYNFLLLHLLANEAGNEALSGACRSSAIEALAQIGKDGRLWAEWLSGSGGVDLATLCHTAGDPERHHLLLSAYALKGGPDAEAVRQHAKKIRYYKDFDALVLSKAI